MPDQVEEEAPAEEQTRPEAIAPWLHTLFLVVVLTLWSIYGMLRLYLPTAGPPRMLVYMSSVIVQYLLVGSTVAGLYHRRQFLSDVLGGFHLRGLAKDVGWGFGVFLGGMGVLLTVGLWVRLFFHPRDHSAVLQAMRPHRPVELVFWLLVSLTAGVCEEFVFRGYLLRQIRCWTGSVGVAIAVSTVVFGCMHFYEGPAAVVQIAALGGWYALVAVRQGNLRRVMVAHFLHDAVAGSVLYLHK